MDGIDREHPLGRFWAHLLETLHYFERVIQPKDQDPPTPSEVYVFMGRTGFESMVGRRFSVDKFNRIHSQHYVYRKPDYELQPECWKAVEQYTSQDQVGNHEALFQDAYDASRKDGSSRDLCDLLRKANEAFTELLPLRMAMDWPQKEALKLWAVWRKLEQITCKIEIRLPQIGTKPATEEPEIGVLPERPEKRAASARLPPDHPISKWELDVVKFCGEGGAKKAWSRNKKELQRVGVDSLPEFKTIYDRQRKKAFAET